METVAQMKRKAEENKTSQGPSLPFFRFSKGSDNRIDPKQPSLTFRFIDELEEMAMTRYHWDNDISKPVRCNKTINIGKKDGKIYLNGNCFYCDKRKEHKEQFEADQKAGIAKTKFCDKKWDLNCNLVARVAVLNDDGSQEFKLLSLNAKDYLYSVAKGFYNTLSDFTEMKASAKKPTKLTDYWWILSPSYKLQSEDKVDQDQLDAEVEGFLDENGHEYDVMNAAPFDYREAMKMRSEIQEVDNAVESYPETNEYDELNPPF
jgi:hypothetical protein